MKDKLKELTERVKGDKRLAVIIVLGLAGIVLLTFSEIKPAQDKPTVSEGDSTDISEYEESLEKRLTELISSIDGAGKTKVMLTLESGDESIYATQDKSGEKTYEKDYVIVKQNGDEGGILLKTSQPEIRGAAVVCEGADSPTVCNEIINTVSAVLGIGTSRVNISKMKQTDGG